MKNFYTSDLHLHHKNVISFEQRPFEDLEEMHNELIERWNKKVGAEDKVYILGDFSFSKDASEVNDVLKQLNGQKVLVRGNHDYFIDKGNYDKKLLVDVVDYLRIVDMKQSVILSHYPMAVWDCSHRGSIHLYGHVHLQREAYNRHPQLRFLDNAYNVGCMNWNYEPVTLEEILGSQHKQK